MAQKEMQTEVEIKDEIGQELEVSMKEQLQKEVDLFTTNIKGKKAMIKDYNEQVDLDKEIYALQLPNFRKDDKGVWEFEKLDEYWVLQKRKHEYMVRMKNGQAEGQNLQMQKELEGMEEQLVSSQSKLDELEKEE